jgi:phage gp46-like protein
VIQALEYLLRARVTTMVGMDAGIDPTTGDLSGKRITTLANAVYLRLRTPLGSWWANPTLGSRLYELQREKDLPRVARLAVQYAQQALQPLLDDGRATAIDVTASQPGNGRLLLVVEVTAADGARQTFEHWVRVV